MRVTRTFAIPLLIALLLATAGSVLWLGHARSWGWGRGGPVLAYDAAQYAVAARELAENGRLATLYALPLELSKHGTPPWPLALVQPGLVIAEAALFALEPAGAGAERREGLVVVVPFLSFLLVAIALGLATLGLLRARAPELGELGRAAAALTVGLAFLLDPEAQHFAAGGFTELPFTLGLVTALAGVAFGTAGRHPLAFGILLGLAGAFRANMLWLAPLLAVAAAATAPAPRRAGVVARVLLGYALPLLPWWIYKWSAFGSPTWDLSRVALWDGIEGYTWFSLNHLPDLPPLPHGAEAGVLIAKKTLRNLLPVLLQLFTGPRALWIGGVALWLLAARRDKTLGAAALVTLAILCASVVVAAATVPQTRYVFPARVAAEAVGMLGVGALLFRLTEGSAARTRAALLVAAGAVALGWGAWRTVGGVQEARAIAEERGVPDPSEMEALVRTLDRRVPHGEPVMSNLGPVLAWYARRPVVHLALTPADVPACRTHLDLRHVVLVFREPARAWPGWVEVLERPSEAPHHPEWNVARAESERTPGGFQVVWLELGPLAPRMARQDEEDGGRTRPGRSSTRRRLREARQRMKVIRRTITWPSTSTRAR